MKTLYLLRHAKAEPGDKSMSDAQRPLAARGLDACVAIGNWLKTQKNLPQLALCSPALRTRQTLEGVMRASGWQPRQEFVSKLYLASEAEILRVVQSADEAPALMVIGHNPGMHHASLELAKSAHTPLRTELELKFPTAALAVLRFDAAHWKDVAFGQGTLAEFVTAGEL